MVAEPEAAPVQRHQQQVRPHQLGQLGRGAGLIEHRFAQRPAHPVEHRGPGQELPVPRRDPPEELRLHVLAHQPVIPAERVLRALDRAAFPQVERGQVQPGGPPFCPLVQRGHVVVAERDVSRAQQRGCLLAAQRQLGRADLQDPALDAQPRYAQRRGVAARQHQPRPRRDVIGQHRQRVPAFGIPEQVRVVEHQHHGRGHRPERRPQPRHHRAGHRAGRSRRAPRTPGHRPAAPRPAPPPRS